MAKKAYTHPGLTTVQNMCRTALTLGKEERSAWNGKPYRTASQKHQAKRTAYQHNGTFYSDAPKSYHPRP